MSVPFRFGRLSRRPWPGWGTRWNIPFRSYQEQLNLSGGTRAGRRLVAGSSGSSPTHRAFFVDEVRPVHRR